MSQIRKGARITAPTTGIAFTDDYNNCFTAISQILAAKTGLTPLSISF